MEKRQKNKIIIIIIAVLAIASFIAFKQCSREPVVKMERTEKITPTPNILTEVKNVGKWEFLDVAIEELVDTTKGKLLKDRMSAIYRGVLRYGIDFSQAEEDWFTTAGDTVFAKLPRVTLLDDFILDEAATQTVFQSGSFTAKDRQDMRDRANTRIIKKGEKSDYLATAQENAKQDITLFLKNLGVKDIVFVDE